MKRPEWILPETVHVLHEQLLAEFGGASGIRDEGLLASALSRPENLFAYGKPSIFERAASYAYGLVKNHPFVDGNKRSGAYSFIWFLNMAGILDRARMTPATLTALTLFVAESHSRHKDKMIGLILQLLKRSSI